jgi:hypothetical protein
LIDGFTKAKSPKIHCYFSDSQLSKIYSMHFNASNGTPDLLAAGGHGGRVSIYGLACKKDASTATNYNDPILSWKAHSGWISGVQFYGGAASNNNTKSQLLLTSGNDKGVVLWDLSQQEASTKEPKKRATNYALHTSGIFHLHEMNSYLITCSKVLCYEIISN